MKFCSNCGHELVKEAKFCSNCGVPQEVANNERQQNWAGNITKCPSCGTEIPGFTAVCSSCGHELNLQSVSASLSKLVSDLDEIERAISTEPTPPARGWKTWANKKRVLLVCGFILFGAVLFVVIFSSQA